MNIKVIGHRMRSNYAPLNISHPTHFLSQAAYLIHYHCLSFKNVELLLAEVVLGEKSLVVTHRKDKGRRPCLAEIKIFFNSLRQNRATFLPMKESSKEPFQIRLKTAFY